uniref:GST C-terminal domain-containing protein n=1 Tax=Zooxanthella nutricula TaxID=1333877 RepID=A0A7S2LLB4_9DINO
MGRVLPVRLALFDALGKDGWEDETITFEEFGAEKEKFNAGKASKLAPLGYLPVMTVGDITITQTEAMARWAGRLGPSKLYPTDPLEAFKVDEIISVTMETLNKTPQDLDKETKKRLREEFAKGLMARNFQYLEDKLALAGPFILGSTLTLADVFLFGLSSMVESGDYDYVPPSFLDGYPKVTKHLATFRGSDLVKNYSAAFHEMAKKAGLCD